MTLDYLDRYPAEMYHWRNLEPYLINAEFFCTINYEIKNMIRKSETLFLNATCKVIKPHFITNLKLQRINFGEVVIGMRKSEPVIIQNIHCKVLELYCGYKISLHSICRWFHQTEIQFVKSCGTLHRAVHEKFKNTTRTFSGSSDYVWAEMRGKSKNYF